MQPSTDVLQREPTIVSTTHYCIVGDVTVDNSATIAPGVVLQALPGSRIVVGRGACLAGGVCVQSKTGVLTISAEAILGANVLVVGSGVVGANACVSPGSTLMNPQVEAGSLLPPNTLTGQQLGQQMGQQTGHQGSGRRGSSPSAASQASSQVSPLPKNTFVEPGPVGPRPVQIPSIDVSAAPPSYDPSKNGVQLNQPYGLGDGKAAGYQSSSALTSPSDNKVYGKEQVSQLISTLFPNRQSLNNGSQ